MAKLPRPGDEPTVYSLASLLRAMKERTTVTIDTPTKGSLTGLINGLALEDGSGRNWLVSMTGTACGSVTVFVYAS